VTLVHRMPLPHPARLAVLRLAAAACALALCAGSASAQARWEYQYSLSDFSGRLPYNWARVSVDQEREETYVIYGNLVRVFNASGMEVFSFGDDLDLGLLLDAAVDERGDVILLSYKDSRTLLTRCNFRGEPIGPIEITNLPDGVSFDANRMALRNGLFYFATTAASTVMITDANGVFRERIEFLPMVEADERQKAAAEMIGFTVDREGNIFFTMPVLFKVFKYSPDRTLASFGRPGSAPGRFGVLAGVASDSQGNLLVLDKLKSVVEVFDKDFNFITEFGYRGTRPENLVVPDGIAVDGHDRLYVTQGRRRGISVFALARQ
jgi:DNA-binding beta-propeller fold protein YncE